MDSFLKLPAPLESKWIESDGVLYYQYGNFSDFDGANEVVFASFDLDGTLIVPRSPKRKFGIDENDWKFMFADIPKILCDLSRQKSTAVVLFTNQGGVGKNEEEKRIFKAKVESIARKLGCRFILLAAICNDWNRKPRGRLWEKATRLLNCSCDLKKSFFVGDAAGRPSGWKKGKLKDFADTDRKFALNNRVDFFTPEEYFLKEDPAPFEISYCDLNFGRDPTTTFDIKHSEFEVIMLVGPPASGKSTFVKKYLQDYVHINQDTLKTHQKCIALLEDSLKSRKSAVIDNTNPSVEKRQQFIKVAKRFNATVRCFVFQTEHNLCLHLNSYREVIVF